MKAGFYQYNPLFGEKEANLKRVAGAVAGAEADLLVLPEFFATGYQFTSAEEVTELSEAVPDGRTTGFIIDLSMKIGAYIVAGLPEKANGMYYNTAVLTGPEGFIGSYRKTHLFFEEKLFFAPGDTGFKVWSTDAGGIGIMICFDWLFPESMRTLALMGAEIVAHPANLVLPHCPSAMPIRCLENRLYCITSNRTGIEVRKHGEPLSFIGKSQIVSPDGAVLASAAGDEESLVVVDIEPSTANNKSINQYNDLFRDRRPEMYKLILHNDLN